MAQPDGRRLEETADALVAWLRREVAEAGADGAVIGLSGGIDSAVTAALCQRAFPHQTLGIILPCHSNPRDAVDARLAADHFGFPVVTVPLEAVYETFLAVLEPAWIAAGMVVDGGTAPEGAAGLARANLKPRLRMATLYALANRLNRLVVGTGNRSELHVGYFTKYGDGGVDLLPLAGLVKTQVRQLARHLGVPQPIIDKPPSAGLWPDQTDEGEMGLTYEVLDHYILTGEAFPETACRIDTLHHQSEHKRRLPSTPPRL